MDKIIAGFEGMEKKVYTDTNGLKTVGVGFNLEQSNGKQIFKSFLPDVSYDDVLSGKTSLTEKQVMKLFSKTLEDKVQTTKGLFANYDNFPGNVQTALVNAVFRGELKATHKTVRLINNDEWSKVADEYLDRSDYREASKQGSKCRGIKTRMDYNANIFRQYAQQVKK